METRELAEAEARNPSSGEIGWRVGTSPRRAARRTALMVVVPVRQWTALDCFLLGVSAPAATASKRSTIQYFSPSLLGPHLSL